MLLMLTAIYVYMWDEIVYMIAYGFVYVVLAILASYFLLCQLRGIG